MNSYSEINTLLHKYFRNECSQSELRTIYKWLADPDNQAEFNNILDRYLQAENKEIPNHISRVNSWQSIAGKIAAEENKHRIGEKRQDSWWQPGKVAAVIIFILLGSAVFIKWDEFFVQPEVTVEQLTPVIKKTEKGQKRTIKLPDGSQVTLNSSSLLTVSPDFMNGETRTVSLQGEAFFEIEKNPERPFLVKADELTTRVLGTSFNINAYQTEEIKVAVRTGKVQVSSPELSLDLVPDEMAVYKQQEGILKSKFDPMLAFGWKDGYLVFEKADFQTLINKLELWYGVNITVRGEKPRDTFTAKYHQESLETVLEGISFSGDFEFQIEEKSLLIEFK